MNIVQEIITKDLKTKNIDTDYNYDIIKKSLQEAAQVDAKGSLILLEWFHRVYDNLYDVVYNPYDTDDYVTLKYLSDIVISTNHSNVNSDNVDNIQDLCDKLDINIVFLQDIVESIDETLNDIENKMQVDHVTFH